MGTNTCDCGTDRTALTDGGSQPAATTHTLEMTGAPTEYVAYYLITTGPVRDVSPEFRGIDQFATNIVGADGLYLISGFVIGCCDHYEIEGEVIDFQLGEGAVEEILWDGQDITNNPQQIVTDPPEEEPEPEPEPTPTSRTGLAGLGFAALGLGLGVAKAGSRVRRNR